MIRKNTTKFLFIILILIISINTAFAEGFLKRSGKNIVDGNGNSVLLRGIGLGGWLVPEGYMLQTSSFANAAWQFRQKIEDLIGTQKTDEFFNLYRKNFVTRKDVQKLKEWGFNSIRLPMHFNLLTPQDQPFSYSEEGFATIDSLLQWCKESQIYLILDLHAAPGGQSKDNIADYNPAYLPLWEDDIAKLRTIYLWKTLAARYANEEWIGGYDLINETAYNFGTVGNQPLRDLFITITNEIRLVDQNHILFIEGNWYATDFGLLSPAWDNNMAYSFHKYWNSTDFNTIGYLNTLRNETNCPLWMGESGENSNQWFTDCIKMLETTNIGWSWWTIKKVEGNNSLMYVNKPAEYDYLLRYWSGTASKPTVDYTVNALNKFAEALKIENCTMNNGVIDAMFRQVGTTSTLPFGLNTIPGTLYASNYDYGQNGFAYKDNDYQNIANSAVWNSGYQYRNDGVDIEKCTDASSNGYDVGWINTGEYLTYTINVAATGIYKLTFRVAANAGTGKILMRLDGQNLGAFIDIPATGGWTSWSNVVVQNIPIPVGAHTLVLNFYNGGFNLSNVKFELISVGVDDGSPKPEKFELTQNYPNPFNPETVINYSIPEQSFVTLKVYDILGKEIITLVNQEKQAGAYSIGFNTSSVPGGLSSGIYFYSIKAGNYYSVKKMTVVK